MANSPLASATGTPTVQMALPFQVSRRCLVAPSTTVTGTVSATWQIGGASSDEGGDVGRLVARAR